MEVIDIKYNETNISCTVIKSKIKNLYIHIKDGQVLIKVPVKMKNEDIKEFVNKKAKWIYKHYIKQKEENQKEKREISNEDIERLKGVVQEAINEYIIKLKVTPNKVRIKEVKYAWGSCSNKKNITINAKLALKATEEIKYVVLHEMCHLIYMNHSKQFWDLVEQNMKEYKIYRKKLKYN